MINIKTIFNRIHYYTRKIVQYSSHPRYLLNKPKWYKTRHNRLMIYKAELTRRIELEGKDTWIK